MVIPVSASIQTEWRLQPQNVQRNLQNQNINIHIVDNLDWNSPNLYDTYAYTQMSVQEGVVQSIDIYLRTDSTASLTHEVGHCISNYNGIPYYWCNTAAFDAVYNAERANNIMMYQGRDSKIEYFACAYDMYIRFPNVLKQSNPLTYNYIKTVLKTI